MPLRPDFIETLATYGNLPCSSVQHLAEEVEEMFELKITNERQPNINEMYI